MTIFEYEIEAEPDGRGTKLEGLVTISETTIDRRDNDLAVLLLHGAGGDLHGGHLDDTSDYLAWMGFPVVRVTMKSPGALYRMRAAHAAMAAAKEAAMSASAAAAAVTVMAPPSPPAPPSPTPTPPPKSPPPPAPSSS